MPYVCIFFVLISSALYLKYSRFLEVDRKIILRCDLEKEDVDYRMNVNILQ